MISPVESLTFVTVPLAIVIGNMAGNIVANATPTPDWATPILGSLGALVFAVLAVKWLIARLEKQEAKVDARDIILDAKEEQRSKERDAHLTVISEMTARTTNVIEQNSAILKDTQHAIEKCSNCEIKYHLKHNLVMPPKE